MSNICLHMHEYIYIQSNTFNFVWVCHLFAGLGERTHTDVEVVTVDSLSGRAAQTSKTVADQNLRERDERCVKSCI